MSNKKEKEELRDDETEELDSLFEDEGDPKYQFLRSLIKKDPLTLNEITELTRSQIKAMAIAEFSEEMIKEEFGVNINISGLTSKIKEMYISHKRMGRTEVLKPLGNDEQQKKKDLFRVLGLRQ